MVIKPHIQAGTSSVSEVTSQKKITGHEVSLKEALDFYLNDDHYTEVHLVRCLKCGNEMCLEVLEPSTQEQFKMTHHQGRRIITLGFDDAPDGYLFSYRKRLDGAMGYQCGAWIHNPKYDEEKIRFDDHNKEELAKFEKDPTYEKDVWSIKEAPTVRCGNNTIISSQEKGFTRIHPSGESYLPPMEPHQQAQLKAKMIREGYKPDIEVNDNKTRIETFEVEQLK